jgi:hypothetical protein
MAFGSSGFAQPAFAGAGTGAQRTPGHGSIFDFIRTGMSGIIDSGSLGGIVRVFSGAGGSISDEGSADSGSTLTRGGAGGSIEDRRTG